MYCRKCQYEIPDNVDICPVCGLPTRRAVRKHNAPLKFLIRFLDIITMLSGLLHMLVLVTASHYIKSSEAGLLLHREYLLYFYPSLLYVDLIFAALYLAIPTLSVMMRYKLMRERRVGKLFLVLALSVTLLWGIAYPLVISAITGVAPYMMRFTLIQAGVYAALAAVPAAILLKSDKFIF